MKIELKNLKYAEFASQETHCFEASLYVDGKRIGVVANDGQGGCNGYTPHTAWETINEYAKTLPSKKYTMNVRNEDGVLNLGGCRSIRQSGRGCWHSLGFGLHSLFRLQKKGGAPEKTWRAGWG